MYHAGRLSTKMLQMVAALDRLPVQDETCILVQQFKQNLFQLDELHCEELAELKRGYEGRVEVLRDGAVPPPLFFCSIDASGWGMTCSRWTLIPPRPTEDGVMTNIFDSKHWCNRTPCNKKVCFFLYWLLH